MSDQTEWTVTDFGLVRLNGKDMVTALTYDQGRALVDAIKGGKGESMSIGLETPTTGSQSDTKGTGIASEQGHCNNGGCTRPIYRGKECFRCWAGTKWTSMRQRVENKNGNNDRYEKVPLLVSKDDLINWILQNPPPQEIEWPSIDRIDNDVGYSLDNIRWLDHRINSKHCQRDIPEGFKQCPGCLQILPLESFGIHNGKPYGVRRQSRCRPCHNTYRRIWYKNKIS